MAIFSRSLRNLELFTRNDDKNRTQYLSSIYLSTYVPFCNLLSLLKGFVAFLDLLFERVPTDPPKYHRSVAALSIAYEKILISSNGKNLQGSLS